MTNKTQPPPPQYTQGPLLVWTSTVDGSVNISAADHSYVCLVGTPGQEYVNRIRADAARIVLCWNSHDELVAALEALADLGEAVPVFQLDDGKSSVKGVRLAGKFMDAMKNARAALAKAKS